MQADAVLKICERNMNEIETLESYISKQNDYTISHNAKFCYFKHRSKVESLRFFIV